MSDTDANLQAAFAGESQANRRYLAFAEKAEQDGYAQVARLFRAAAAAETVHAHNHFQVMGGVESTLENLNTAADGEAYEFQDMYPSFLEKAEEEGDESAAGTFGYANQVEKVHYKLYSRAIEAVEEGGDLPETEMYVCQTCGNTVEGEVPEKCPVCGAPASFFENID